MGSLKFGFDGELSLLCFCLFVGGGGGGKEWEWLLHFTFFTRYSFRVKISAITTNYHLGYYEAAKVSCS